MSKPPEEIPPPFPLSWSGQMKAWIEYLTQAAYQAGWNDARHYPNHRFPGLQAVTVEIDEVGLPVTKVTIAGTSRRLGG
jgi:hypothetical protein